MHGQQHINICRMLFQNKINLRCCASGWFYYREKTFQHTAIPWNSQVRYLGLLLDPKLLFTRHLTSVTHKATGIFLQLFPLLARDSTLSIPNKITLYKLSIRPILTYAAPVWSNTSSSNYRRLQILQ